MTATLRTHNLHRSYHLRGETVHAVKGVSLEAPNGRMTAIVGPSGSGKTTFLNLISGLDDPDEGEIWLNDTRIDQLDKNQRRILRLEKVGFVFQSFGLLPLLSATENVGAPLRMRYMNASEREDRVAQALDWVGLSERASHRPYELSGGEQQRVAVARAIASEPDILLADEPTGQLDTFTGQMIIELLRRLVEEKGITAVIVSHDPKVMREADIVHELSDGALLETREKTLLA